MAFLYGINFGVALLLTILLIRKNSPLSKKEEKLVTVRPNRWLSLLMGVSACIFLLLAIGSRIDSLPLFFKLFAGGAGFMLLPAIFFTYILALVNKSTRWFWLFSIPFVLHYGWQLWTGTGTDKFGFYYGLTIVHYNSTWEQWLGVIVFSSQALFPIAGLYQIDKYQSEILDRFSDLSEVDLQWVQRLLWGILIVLLFAILMVAPWGNTAIIPFEWSLPILFSLVSVQQIYIAYFGLFQSSIFIPLQEKTDNNDILLPTINPSDIARHPSTTDRETKVKQLKEFMISSEIYQQSRLTIDELSNQLGWAADDISDIINIGMQKNFFEFVNEFRVEAIIEQMKQAKNQQATLLNMALHCGFNSKTAFNTTFKKITGQTPSGFRKNQSIR